jgi:hypothetical protein
LRKRTNIHPEKLKYFAENITTVDARKILFSGDENIHNLITGLSP